MLKTYIIEESDTLSTIKDMMNIDKHFHCFMTNKTIFHKILRDMEEHNEIHEYKSGADNFGMNEIYGKIIFLG